VTRDFICTCGHMYNDHILHSNVKSTACRKRIGWGINGTAWADNCKEFIADNLRYLEELSNGRE